MRRQSFKLSGVTKAERNQVMSAMSDAISAADGWITDHSLFSNIFDTTRFAVPFQGLAELKTVFGRQA